MNEEEKAIKWIESVSNNIALKREDLHYAKILYNLIINLQKELKKCEEDISFCLHSIVQEKNTSTDKRTRQEMLSCEQILSERLKKLRRNKNVK